MEKQLLSRAELAEAISISTRAIDRLVASKKIPVVKVGTRSLFDVEKVIDALKSGVASPENGGLD